MRETKKDESQMNVGVGSLDDGKMRTEPSVSSDEGERIDHPSDER